jgi:gluconolactonase
MSSIIELCWIQKAFSQEQLDRFDGDAKNAATHGGPSGTIHNLVQPNVRGLGMVVTCSRALILTFALLGVGCSDNPPPAENLAREVPLPESLLESSDKVDTAVSIAFTEGPAVDAEGNVFFSEIRGNRILKYTPDSDWTEFRRPSRRANGLTFDSQGRLLACEGAREGGGRQVTRTDMREGRLEVLADRYRGKRLNSPNDLVVDSMGRIYFTDPRYGGQEGRELETEDVYMIETDGSLKRILTLPDIHKPNGIGISPDGKSLYVADTKPGPPVEARLMVFDLQDDGIPSNGRVLHSFGSGRGIDGMAIDKEGNIYGAAGNNNNPPENKAGVYVITPEGALVGRIPIPEDEVTNCTFGGNDLRTLYITAGKNLYRIRTKNAGHLPYPPVAD